MPCHDHRYVKLASTSPSVPKKKHRTWMMAVATVVKCEWDLSLRRVRLFVINTTCVCGVCWPELANAMQAHFSRASAYQSNMCPVIPPVIKTRVCMQFKVSLPMRCKTHNKKSQGMQKSSDLGFGVADHFPHKIFSPISTLNPLNIISV